MVEIVAPKIGETVYDPACGSCGFLAQSYLYMKKNEQTIEDYRMLQEKTFLARRKSPFLLFWA